jgi:hypothetical protein
MEGSVYRAQFKYPRYFYDTIVIKKVELKQNKYASLTQLMINSTPTDVYSLFLTKSAFNIPVFTEIISQTLTDQLILQGICPHFAMNLYWEYDNSILLSYNDFANMGDFDSWGNKQHPDEVWFNALFQIMYGLLALRRYFNMIHSDFHTGNILVQKVEPGGYWTYIIDEREYHVPNLGFVFLIHDFGFAWIPDKLMPVEWHYSDTLKHLTPNGHNFYDMQSFIYWVLQMKRIPKSVKRVIESSFADEEIKHVFTREFYKGHPKKHEGYINPSKYPNIDSTYTGLNTTLADKIYQIFFAADRSSFDYSSHPKEKHHSKLIETYSLDKPMQSKKLPQALRSLLVV